MILPQIPTPTAGQGSLPPQQTLLANARAAAAAAARQRARERAEKEKQRKQEEVSHISKRKARAVLKMVHQHSLYKC